MADREENVYQAKLAEQAERYDGRISLYVNIGAWWLPGIIALSVSLTDHEISVKT